MGIQLLTKTTLLAGGLGIWIVALVMISFNPTEVFFDEYYKYHVMCPISYDKEFKLVKMMGLAEQQRANIRINSPNNHVFTTNDLLNYQATNDPILNSTYVVFIKVRYNHHPDAFLGKRFSLTYCSLAAEWGQECKDTTADNYVCTSPGPMFFVKQGQPIDVVWVSDILVEESQGMSSTPNDLYHQNNQDPTSFHQTKSEFQVENSCSFTSPTQDLGKSGTFKQFDWSNIPISTHINGLEVRPTFDGNPNSWFLGDGSRGIGFMSLGLNDDYYNNELFPESEQNVQDGTKLLLAKGAKNVKHNRYLNQQPAGTLYYHDNSLKAKYYNIRNGLLGAYVIYNQDVEKYLNSVSEHVIITMIDGYLPPQVPPFQEPLSGFQGNLIYTWTSMYTKKFNRDTLYRIKIIVSNLFITNIFNFTYTNKQNITVSLPVSVLGTDASLFEEVVHNVSEFTLGNGQRAEIFLDLSKIPDGVTNFTLNLHALNLFDGVDLQLPTVFELGSKPSIARAIPNNLPSIPKFIDLRNVSPSVMRFRYFNIFFNASNSFYSFPINGHANYTSGQSENPKIGTTQDWFFTSELTNQEDHYIHIPLVQFQIIEKFSLRQYRDGCSFYSLNFHRAVNYNVSAQKRQLLMTSNDAMCDFIDQEVSGFQHMPELAQAHLETQMNDIQLDPIDQAYEPNKTTKASGEYILNRIQEGQESSFAPKTNYSQNCNPLYAKYRYICDEIAVPAWQKKWKVVGQVPIAGVLRIRIRWASTDYPLDDQICQNVKSRTTGDVQKVCRPNDSLSYFKTSEIALSEYPGYAYFCHTLYHNDFDMIRPVMLQFSDRFKRMNPRYKDWNNWASVMNSNKYLNCMGK